MSTLYVFAGGCNAFDGGFDGGPMSTLCVFDGGLMGTGTFDGTFDGTGTFDGG